MTWASDVPVSMPVPLDHEGLVPMGGFIFTARGLFHEITEATAEDMAPSFAPVFDPRNPEAVDGSG